MESPIQPTPMFEFNDLNFIFRTLVYKYSLSQPRSYLNLYSEIVLAGPYKLPDNIEVLLSAFEEFLSRGTNHRILIAMVSYKQVYQILYLYNQESSHVLYHDLPEAMNEIIERTRYYAASLNKIFEDIKLQPSQESIPIMVHISNIEEICRIIAQDTSIDLDSIYQIIKRVEIKESHILKLSSLYESYIIEAKRAIATSEELPRLSLANISFEELDQKLTIKPSNSALMTQGLLDKYLDYPVYVD